MEILTSFNEELSRKEFDAIPFINADGYHSKTIAYSIWHIFRIEDIVAHTSVSYTHLDVYKRQVQIASVFSDYASKASDMHGNFRINTVF